MDWILGHRWLVLVVLEILAWSVTFFMLYARYKLRSMVLFRIAAVLFFLTGVIPQGVLGLWNFLREGTVDIFTLAVAGLLLYGATLGRRQVRHLDAWARQKFAAK